MGSNPGEVNKKYPKNLALCSSGAQSGIFP